MSRNFPQSPKPPKQELTTKEIFANLENTFEVIIGCNKETKVNDLDVAYDVYRLVLESALREIKFSVVNKPFNADDFAKLEEDLAILAKFSLSNLHMLRECVGMMIDACNSNDYFRSIVMRVYKLFRFHLTVREMSYYTPDTYFKQVLPFKDNSQSNAKFTPLEIDLFSSNLLSTSEEINEVTEMIYANKHIYPFLLALIAKA